MRALVASSIASVLLLGAVTARAGDVEACLSASEKGQRARSSGKLREARDLFQACGAETCPAMVRRDCAQWQVVVTQALPTVVFGAKDGKGSDLFEVKVSMDGEVIVNKLDGKSVAVDPGPHTFQFEVAGLPPVTERALVKEGEKSRAMSVTFGPGAEGSAPARGDKRATSDGGRGHTALPWIVVGVGAATVAVGAVVFLTAPELPTNCNASTKVCQKVPATETDAQLANDQDQAGKHDSQPVTGAIVMGAGAALVIGGLVWHFLEPTGPEQKAGVRVTPWTSASSAGVSLGGLF
jgi:hypothetical protein